MRGTWNRLFDGTHRSTLEALPHCVNSNVLLEAELEV